MWRPEPPTGIDKQGPKYPQVYAHTQGPPDNCPFVQSQLSDLHDMPDGVNEGSYAKTSRPKRDEYSTGQQQSHKRHHDQRGQCSQ